jgi:hypothetical protein
MTKTGGADTTLSHMIARYLVKTGVKPSAREVMAMVKAKRYLDTINNGADTVIEEQV